jgi:octaprenyl-diphosphate synthase
MSKPWGERLCRSSGFVIPQDMDIKIYSASDFPQYLPKLNLLYDELFSGGKGFRAKLVQSVASSLSLPDDGISLLCQTIEFIHNSSLLHDDLVDRSSLRRGKTAAWLKYTPESAVLAGDYLLARVMVNLSEYGNVDLIRLTSKAISDLLEGEWLQDTLMKRSDVTPAELDRVHDLKTASLFIWCLRAPFIALNIKDDKIHDYLSELGLILGFLLQRSDDLLDFNIRNHEQKATMGDLNSGYMNSFCAFVLADLPEEKRRQAFASKDLDLFKSVVGENVFAEKLKAFDEMNDLLIKKYQTLLNRLEGLVPSTLISTLSVLPQPIYWRQAP